MVGISKISASLFAVMLDTVEQRFNGTRHLDYETDWLVSAAMSAAISCPVVEQLVWCEIDDDTHLYRAKNEIYPALKGLARDQLGRN
jgi:2-aminoethylphosphonate-pyruvate transaminase